MEHRMGTRTMVSLVMVLLLIAIGLIGLSWVGFWSAGTTPYGGWICLASACISLMLAFAVVYVWATGAAQQRLASRTGVAAIVMAVASLACLLVALLLLVQQL